MKIVIEQNRLKLYEKEVMHILRVVERPVSLVTELAQMGDFYTGYEEDGGQKEREHLLQLSEESGRPVTPQCKVWEVARDIHSKTTRSDH